MGTRWTGATNGAARVALAYVLLSGAWVFTSDWWLGLVVTDPGQLTTLQTLKGVAFVALSGVLLFGLIRREQRELAETNRDLERTLQHAMVLHRLLRHNLRNSCDVIQNNVALLRTGRGDETANRERIRRQAAKLSTIASKSQHLRDVVFDEADLVEQDLVALAEEGVAASRREYPDATFVLESPPRQRVRAHPRLAIAIEELLNNAVVHHESLAAEVTVALDREGDEVVVRITDDGPGLPHVERAVLEDGVEDALTHSRGIGLWVVRFIVTASGGSLTVPSTGPSGTVVSVRLPVVED